MGLDTAARSLRQRYGLFTARLPKRHELSISRTAATLKKRHFRESPHGKKKRRRKFYKYRTGGYFRRTASCALKQTVLPTKYLRKRMKQREAGRRRPATCGGCRSRVCLSNRGTALRTCLPPLLAEQQSAQPRLPADQRSMTNDQQGKWVLGVLIWKLRRTLFWDRCI